MSGGWLAATPGTVDVVAMRPPVIMPTMLIPCACKCSWAVVKQGVGLACMARLKRPSAGCSYRHEPAGSTLR